MKKNLTADSIIYLNGRKTTLQQIADTHAEGDLDVACGIVDAFIKRGKAKLEEEVAVRQDKAMQKAMNEQKVIEAADLLDDLEDQTKDYAAEVKKVDRALYPKLEIVYPNQLKAMEDETFFRSKLRIKDTEVVLKKGQIFLILRNVSDAEYNAINRHIATQSAVSNAVSTVNKGAESLTNTVDYAAKNVFAPVAKVGVKAGVNLGRTLFSTAFRAGAAVLTAGVQGVKDVAHDINHDPEVLRARREMISIKDGALKRINGGRADSKRINIFDE